MTDQRPDTAATPGGNPGGRGAWRVPSVAMRDPALARIALATGTLRARWTQLGRTRWEQAGAAAYLERAGIDLHLTGPGPSEQTLDAAREVLASARDTRSQLAVERRRRGIEAGEKVGRTGYGHDRAGRVDHTDPVLTEVVRLRLLGHSYQAIADHLTDHGHRRLDGSTTWHARTVQRIWQRAQQDQDR